MRITGASPAGAVVDVPAARAQRVGYEGARRRILVVDNEEADRDLIARWLLPLGFDVTLATHGEDALRAVANGLRPHAVFMDLAMPGIDGWETLRRLRALELSPAPACAVVSANAFDKGLDNDLDLPPRDFLVKPVRREDLLEWLGQRLGLDWTEVAAPAGVVPAAPAPTDTLVLPAPSAPTLNPEAVTAALTAGIADVTQHLAGDNCKVNDVLRRLQEAPGVRAAAASPSQMPSSSSCINSRVWWSRAPKGSSISSMRGPLASARAIATRCCMPPESCLG